MAHDDDDFLGSDDDMLGAADVQAAAGDEIDFAETVKRMNPTADQLQHFATLRAQKHALLNAQAPFVRNNPSTVLTGSLGNQVNVQPGDVKQVANWIGDDAEAMAVTITLGAAGIFPQTNVAAASAIRPYAIVQFGTRGCLVKAEVDIGQGSQFTVGASQVTLQVAMESTPAGSVIPIVPLTGMLSFHTTQKANPVTRTKYADGVVHLGHAVINIPPFARNVTVWRNLQADSFSVSVLDNTITLLYNEDVAGGAYMTEPLPLSGDAAAIVITNSGADTVNYRAVFNLGL